MRLEDGPGRGYAVQRTGLRPKIVEVFPLTEGGWQRAWACFAELNPQGATEYLRIVEARRLAPSLGPVPGRTRVTFERSTYLGGFPEHLEPERMPFTFVATEEALGGGGVVVFWRDVVGIAIDGGQAAASRVIPALAFGVLGALAAKPTMDRAFLVVRRTDGALGLFEFDRTSPQELRVRLNPVLLQAHVRVTEDILSESPEMGSPPGVGSWPVDGTAREVGRAEATGTGARSSAGANDGLGAWSARLSGALPGSGAGPGDASRLDGTSPVPAGVPVVSVADELLKLASLRASGLLTDEEFERQKRRLLS